MSEFVTELVSGDDWHSGHLAALNYDGEIVHLGPAVEFRVQFMMIVRNEYVKFCPREDYTWSFCPSAPRFPMRIVLLDDSRETLTDLATGRFRFREFAWQENAVEIEIQTRWNSEAGVLRKISPNPVRRSVGVPNVERF